MFCFFLPEKKRELSLLLPPCGVICMNVLEKTRTQYCEYFLLGFSFLFFNRDDLSRNYMTSYLKINNSSNIDRTWQSHWHIYRISPCLWYVEYMLSSTDSQKFYLEGILKIANKSFNFHKWERKSGNSDKALFCSLLYHDWEREKEKYTIWLFKLYSTNNFRKLTFLSVIRIFSGVQKVKTASYKINRSWGCNNVH